MQHKTHHDQEIEENIKEEDNIEESGTGENLEEKCSDLENKYKRALADYQNLVKQTAQEKTEIVKYANEQLIYEILPVYDNLKISLLHAGDESTNGWLEGIKHVIRQFKDVLTSHGVEEIRTIGEKFDHHTMEAIDKELTEDQDKDGSVAKELKAGYKLRGKIISAARVVVYEYKN